MFIVPISVHTDAPLNVAPYVMTPITGVTFDSGSMDFGFHTTQWYSENGRYDYFFDALTKQNSAMFWNSLYIINNDHPEKISVSGLFTIFTMYGIALYLLLSLFPYKGIKITADILLLTLAILSLIGFFTLPDAIVNFFDFNMPIFPIVAGILSVLFLIVDINTHKKKRKKK